MSVNVDVEQPLSAVDLDLVRDLLQSLPGPGYRSVSVSFEADQLGGEIVTMTVSIGGSGDDE